MIDTDPKISDEAAYQRPTSLYQEFLAEREQILKHKWIESERLGYDIGFDKALLDWVRNHRSDWVQSVRVNRVG